MPVPARSGERPANLSRVAVLGSFVCFCERLGSCKEISP